MTGPWPVPASFHDHVRQWPGVDQWYPQLSMTAARWAQRWQLRPDGVAMRGWTGIVWPVRLRDGSAAVLKVSPPVSWTEGSREPWQHSLAVLSGVARSPGSRSG